MDSKDKVNDREALIKENQRLRRALEEISIINEIATAISATHSLERILDLIVRKCVKYLQVEQGAVMLLDERKEEKPFQTMVRRGDTSSDVFPYRLDMQLTGWMLKNRKPLLINDFRKDVRFTLSSGEGLAIHSILSVPLILQGQMIGLLTLFDKKTKDGFSEDDQRLLSIIAAQSAQVIENARLLLEEQALRRMQEELRLAYEIQTNLLPREFPAVPGYDFFGQSVPAKEVGGDYFDFVPVGDNCIAFCLGDVSGKGMPAALLMSNLQAIIRSQTMLQTSPADCLSHANRQIFHCTSAEKFATLFYGRLDAARHQLAYANAGQNPPLLFTSEREWKILAGGGIVLGCWDVFSYADERVELAPGSLLLLYSDGITEAMNKGGEEFGVERLARVAAENIEESAANLGGLIVRAAQSHAGSMAQADDMTVLIIKRKKG